ncbi:4Fe-4S dicluster domain-containing protein [Wolinella succinogenes]|uniref:4Fe-4S dicluster domain-containing protein n=1 Tax=Wolinella succinogenes TaxID=844 RepID=UPI00240A84ED|nr:4Fe-4S dicluster domain-containing protein [Wolinella succinogenes]
MAKNYAMVIDLNRCVGCGACDLACKSENNTPVGIHWSNHVVETTGVFPNVSFTYRPTLCNHCDDAPCVRACPTGAMYKDKESGMTLHNADKCIGCKSCMLADPYHVIYYNAKQPHYKWTTTKPTVTGMFSPKEMADKSGAPYPYFNVERGKTYEALRFKGLVEKCTFCDHRVKAGLMPHCVVSCPGDARIFGDLNDPKSSVSQLLAKYPAETLLPHKGTKAKVFYIRSYARA